MSARLATRHQLQLVELGSELERRAGEQLRRVNVGDIDRWWGSTSAALVGLTTQGYDIAALMALRYLSSHARENGVQVDPQRVAASTDQIETALHVTGPVAFKQHLALSGDTDAAVSMMRRRLAGSISRLALGGSRQATMATVNGSPAIVGYRRRARAGACDFCSMLAGRGAVYKSRSTASGVVGDRGSRKVGESFHDHCSCITEPVYRIE